MLRRVCVCGPVIIKVYCLARFLYGTAANTTTVDTVCRNKADFYIMNSFRLCLTRECLAHKRRRTNIVTGGRRPPCVVAEGHQLPAGLAIGPRSGPLLLVLYNHARSGQKNNILNYLVMFRKNVGHSYMKIS